MFESMRIIKIPNPSPRKARSNKNVNILKLLEELRYSPKSRDINLNKMKNYANRDIKVPSVKVRQLPLRSIEFKHFDSLAHHSPKQKLSPSQQIKQKLGLSTSFKRKISKEKTSFNLSKRFLKNEPDESEIYSSFQPPSTFTHSFNSYKHFKKGIKVNKSGAIDIRNDNFSTQKILNQTIQRFKTSFLVSKNSAIDKFLSK